MKINENQKVTLTFGQLKKLVRESYDPDVTLTVPFSTYEEWLDDRRTFWANQNKDVDDDVWELAVDFIRDTGLPDNPDPRYVVDNLVVNTEVVHKDTWKNDYSDKYEKYDGDWDEFCGNEAVTYNDRVAVLRFGF